MCDKKKCWKKYTQKNIIWESVILLAFFVLLIVWGTTAINSDTSANTAMLLLSTYTGIHINDHIQSPA